MRNALLFLAAVLVASTAHGASPSPPASLVFILCQVDDLTGTRPPPGTPGVEVLPAPGWRDLELRIIDGAYQCKRVAIENVEDASVYQPHATVDMAPLAPNFANHAQCARAGIMMASDMNKDGWAVVAIGCPTPIMSDNGTPDDTSDDFIVGWKLPECPTYLPGTNNRMQCRFDESNV